MVENEQHSSEAKMEESKQIALERRAAMSRLRRLELIPKFNKAGFHAIEHALIEIYAYSKVDVSLLGEQAAYTILREAIGHDLLLRELYDELGEPSLNSDKYYPDIDVRNFVESGKSWTAIMPEINDAVPFPEYDSELNDAVGSTSLLTLVEDEIILDPVERYSHEFGIGSVLALPFIIELSRENISVSHNPNFVHPHGGTINQERIVFFPNFDTKMPKMKKKK